MRAGDAVRVVDEAEAAAGDERSAAAGAEGAGTQ